MYLKLRVGALMRDQNISEKEMSERADLARNTVRALMRGSVARVDLETLEKIAGVLKVRPLELFEETAEKPGRLMPAGAAL
jgi:transcriptional regulator with XRE-family HTH domain